ncbi:MAG: methylated-DNA--[protein]-cysteine S-methyltransferase [Gemmatimonadaceae bacterium]
MNSISESYALFETPIGTCGIAWGERGVVAVQLPEATERETRTRMLRGRANAREEQPPPSVQRGIVAIVALLRGENNDLTDITLDMRGVPDFQRRVYELARAIPVGDTSTYGVIATKLGDPTAARAVGQALGRNPFPIVIPCHRVLAANGKLGGFSGGGGHTTKLRMLAIEGAQVRGELGLKP